MALTMSRIEPSAFDTELLGLRVGKTRLAGLTRDILEELRAELTERRLDIVFVRDTDFRFERVAELSWTSVELADVKTTLSRPVHNPPSVMSDAFVVTSTVGPDDTAGLVDLVHLIARQSRFHRCFGEAAARRVYEAWLANAIAGRAADWCFVARSRVNESGPAGLIAVKRDGDTADLALVATAQRYQGQGVLKQMMSAVLATLRAAGVAKCTVATQLSNRTAFRAYQALDFAFDGTLVDLHVSRTP